jgi:NADH:ubiquinone oxidoreductase subunit F (NADH-binding)
MSCEMAGAEDLIGSLETAMGEKVRVQRVPCIGRCDKAPVAVVGMHPVEFADVQKVDKLVEQGITEPETLAPILFEQYVANGGYSIYQQCMAGQHNVDKVLDMMDDSGLRGLGGAGFPVGRKWRIVRDQPAPRLMAVNIDEGEPGTFKDKYYLDRDPHCFLEGMLIAAWAVDINEIYIYLRDEYAAIRVMLEQELAKLRSHDSFTSWCRCLYLWRRVGND